MPVTFLPGAVRIEPVGQVEADVDLPGSKSLTNRYLACAALADGRTTIERASLSDDAHAMVRGLRALGVDVEVDEARARLHVTGRSGGFRVEQAELDVGAAGTAMRFLAALACVGCGHYRLDGSQRMRARPIGDLVDALRSLGAKIECEEIEGYPPLVVHADGLRGGEVVLESPPSSQFISALLMAAPACRGDVLVDIRGACVSEPYIAMTLEVMRELGVESLVSDDGRRFIVPAPQRYQAGSYQVEPDASAATYFWAAAAVTGGRVRVRGLSRASRQGDVGFVDVLAQMGCQVHTASDGLDVHGPADGRLRGVTVDLNGMPDTAQTLAAIALFADGPTRIENVANLRVKETDRIAALACELGKLGARVDTRTDGLTIYPPPACAAAEIETYDDHRMAMSFAVVGLRVPGLVIRHPEVVTKSFPGFFSRWDALATAQR